MLLQLQKRDDEPEEFISLPHVVGMIMDSDVSNPEKTVLFAYFQPVPQPGAPDDWGHPSIKVGEFIEYDDAMKVYQAIQRLDWNKSGSVRIPDESEDVDEALKEWTEWRSSRPCGCHDHEPQKTWKLT